VAATIFVAPGVDPAVPIAVETTGVRPIIAIPSTLAAMDQIAGCTSVARTAKALTLQVRLVFDVRSAGS
jgi:hypothetical protein